jgi:4-phytase/acid phosphatase
MSVKSLPLVFSALLAGLSFPLLSFADDAPATQNLQLQQAVILSRHGVRAPTKQTKKMEQVAAKDWPVWPVKFGYLTPRGEHLVTLMGGYYGEYFRKEGLISDKSCPANGAIFGWGDVDQRTRLTTQALLNGIAPGCHLDAHFQKDLKKADPLFHALKAKVCKLDEKTAQQAIEQQAGGSLSALDKTYAPQLQLMSNVLDYPHSAYCQKMQKKGQQCELGINMPSSVKVKENGTDASLKGAIGLSSTLAEIFLLQDAQGMTDPAWGNIKDQKTWQGLMALHNLQFSLMSGTPYLAKSNGTPILQAIDSALGAPEKPASGYTLPTGNKLLILGGHDTNIENVAGALGLNWSLDGQPDNTPPAGALVFERWQNRTSHQQYISLKIVYQTQDQMRSQQVLTLNNPPSSIAITLPGCENIGPNKLCAIKTFHQVMTKAQLPRCKI